MRSYIVVIVLCISAIGFGQEEYYRPSLSIGFRGGVSRSNMDFIPSTLEVPVDNYYGGFVFNYLGEPRAGIQIEANITSRGWTEGTDSLSSLTYTRQTTYLELPLLTHICFQKKFLVFTIDFGPYLAFKLDSKEYFKRNFPEEVISPLAPLNNVKPYFNAPLESDTDYGFMGGGGLGVKTKAGTIQIDFRYVQGMKSLLKAYPYTEFRFSQQHSIYLGMSYYYSFYFRPRIKF